MEFSLCADMLRSDRTALVKASSLHDAADPGNTLRVPQAPLVPDQHGLVPVAAVPGRLAAVQVGGGGGRLQLLLLLLPDQQGRVPVPQPCVRL